MAVDKRGVSAIGAVLAVLIFSLLMAVAVSVVTIGASIGLQEEMGVKAFYIAEGGLQYALNNGTLCDFDVASTPLGGGSFVVGTSCMGAWAGCSAPTTLSNPAVAASTTIDVASTAGYVIPGTIMVQNEYAFCNAASANQFSGCARGAKGTTAADHAAGTQVLQCTVTSTGTVSTGLFFGDVKRTVRANVGR